MAGILSRFVVNTGALVAAMLICTSCGKAGDAPGAQGGPNGGAPGAALGAGAVGAPGDAPAAGAGIAFTKMSIYNLAEFTDIAIAPDGRLHLIFSEREVFGKPHFLYYATSADAGKTWTDPRIISDDESGEGASYARILIDAQGRLTAVWKYVEKGTYMDGPGGYTPGRLAFRVLEGGRWSKRIPLSDPKVAAVSWFASLDPAGKLHVVWSGLKPADASLVTPSHEYANQLQHAVLDGAAAPTVRVLHTSAPILNQAEQDAKRAAGGTVTYDDVAPRKEGLINLRGFVDARGTARFVAEDMGLKDASGSALGRRVVYWDGERLLPVYQFDRYQTSNTFHNPPGLLYDAAGRTHLLRVAEKASTPGLRDYTLDADGFGDATRVIAPTTANGTMTRWQTHQLPGGLMAVTATLSALGGSDPADAELYITYSRGDGQWTPPVSLTKNASATTFNSTLTTTTSSVSTLTKQQPVFAAIAIAPNGAAYLAMVNKASSIVGFVNPGQSMDGSTVSIASGFHKDEPAVYVGTIPPPPPAE